MGWNSLASARAVDTDASGSRVSGPYMPINTKWIGESRKHVFINDQTTIYITYHSFHMRLHNFNDVY